MAAEKNGKDDTYEASGEKRKASKQKKKKNEKRRVEVWKDF